MRFRKWCRFTSYKLSLLLVGEVKMIYIFAARVMKLIQKITVTLSVMLWKTALRDDFAAQFQTQRLVMVSAASPFSEDKTISVNYKYEKSFKAFSVQLNYNWETNQSN